MSDGRKGRGGGRVTAVELIEFTQVEFEFQLGLPSHVLK